MESSLMEERILIVDDEPLVTDLLARYLKAKGYACETAGNGEEVLSKVREKAFALVLLDIRMPGMGGIELLKEVKALDPDVAAVMVTAVRDEDITVTAVRLGADDYIVKPFDLEEVAISVQKALDKRRLILENREYQRDLERQVAERTREMERLLEETRRRLRESEALFRVSQAFASVLDLDELLQVIIDSAVETIVPAERGVIHILDEANGELHPKALSGKALGALRERKMRIGEGIAGYALEQGQAINVPDVNVEPHFLRLNGDLGFKSLLVVPLILGRKRLGTLSVDSEDVGAFTEDDERLLTTLATQAAIAIENARLYEEVRKELAERKQAEEELTRVATDLTQLIDTANAPIFGVDANGLVNEWNRKAAKITGYSKDEVLGRNLLEDFITEDYKVLVKEVLDNALAGKETSNFEFPLYTKDGKRVELLLNATTRRDASGNVVGVVGVGQDITYLKEVDRLKSNIVANVSHELRTPLASIKAYTELLLDELDEGDRAVRRRFLTVIDEETDGLTALINDFLDLSRLESGRFELRKRPLNLGKVVDYVISLLNVQAQNKGIDIKVDIPSDLPLILADEELMVTLIRNLLSNAVKFSYEGGEVGVKAWEEDGQLIFSVSDQGIGIPSEDLPHLFEKFYRVRSAMESGIKGTGLGLVLAKEAAEAHGGRIEVESKVGVGSRFIVTLQAERSPEASP